MLHSINYCMCVFLKFITIYFFLYYRGPCVRKLFTGLIMYLPSQNKEHCIVLNVKGVEQLCFVVSLYNFVESNTMATKLACFRLSDKWKVCDEFKKFFEVNNMVR